MATSEMHTTVGTAASPRELGKTLLQVENLSKLFPVGRGRRAGAVRAVDRISLHVRFGETLGVVGENGCGKTTLGKLCLRLLQPTFGQVAFDDENITDLGERALRPIRRRMQPIFQGVGAALNPQLTVSQVVREGLRIHHVAPTTQHEDALTNEIIQRVGLDLGIGRRHVHWLSLGERQRVALARALVLTPDLLVCDEPVSALDPSVRAQIVNLMLDLQQELRLAYLLISHDLRTVSYMSHRVAVMYLGRIVETGATKHVTHRSAHPYTRALFSGSHGADSGGRRLRVLVESAPPDPLTPPSGCSFHPRCPHSKPGLCDQASPPLEELGPGTGHWVACFNPLG